MMAVKNTNRVKNRRTGPKLDWIWSYSSPLPISVTTMQSVSVMVLSKVIGLPKLSQRRGRDALEVDRMDDVDLFRP